MNEDTISITHRRTWARSRTYWPYRMTLSHSIGLKGYMEDVRGADKARATARTLSDELVVQVAES